MEIKNFTATTTYHPEHIILRWDFAYPVEPIKDYTVKLYYGFSTKVITNPIATLKETFSYNFRNVAFYQAAITVYFRLDLIKDHTGEVVDSKTIVATPVPEDTYARAIRLQYELYLRRVLREPQAILHPKMWSGNRCPACWDNVNRCSRTKNCKVCFGTGIEGGFLPPTEIFISLTEPPTYLDIQPSAITKTEGPSTGWTVSYPILTAGDVIQLATGEFLAINNVNYMSKGSYPILQIAALTPVASTSVVNDLAERLVNSNYGKPANQAGGEGPKPI